MSKTLTRQIFGSQGPQLTLQIDAPGATTLSSSAELSGGKSFAAYGSQIQFGGQAKATLQLIGQSVDLSPTPLSQSTAQLDPLGTFNAPKNKQWADLRLALGASVDGSGSLSQGSVSLALSAKANVGTTYRLVRSVPKSDDALVAAGRILGETLLPFSRDLQSFNSSDWHEITLDAGLGFSAELTAGKTLSLDSSDGPLKDLLPEDSPQMVAQINALAKASLGLQLLDEVRLGAGSLPATRNARWVRYRLARQHQGSISFGASLAVDLLYNRQVLQRILTAALTRVGYFEIQPELLEIAAAINPNDLTVAALEQKLSAELFEKAKQILPIDAASGKIANDAKDLLQTLQSVNRAVAKLDTEYRSLVNHLLGSTSLAAGKPLREALEQLSQLSSSNLTSVVDGFLDGKLAHLEPLIELLARRGINELLLAGEREFGGEIDRLAAQAKKLLAVVQKVDSSTLEEVVAKATGSDKLNKLLAFLQQAPSDPAQLQSLLEQKADAELQKLVEKVAGRVVSKISAARLARLRQWATRVNQALLDAANIDKKLAGEIDQLRNQVGFVISFTLDRQTRRSAVLDVELDPGSVDCRQAFRSLAAGNLEEFTRRLPFQEDPAPGGEARAQPFFFHHFSLASQRSTQITWLFSPSIGDGKKRTRKAFDSTNLSIEQNGSSVQRSATYSGGLVLSVADDKQLRSWQGSIWLTSAATGKGPSIAAEYDAVTHQIQLSTVRLDDRLSTQRRADLDRLLEFLGFGPRAVSQRLPLQATASHLEVNLVLEAGAHGGQNGEDPVAALLTPLHRTAATLTKSSTLDEAFLQAAGDWLSDPLVTSEWTAPTEQEALPAIVRSAAYRDVWRSGDLSRPFTFRSGAVNIPIHATAQPGGRFAPVLQGLSLVRGWASRPYAKLGNAWQRVETASGSGGAGVSPDDLGALSRAFRRATRTSTPNLGFWRSPLFQHWLLFDRLRSVGMSPPPMRGVAALTWRTGAQDWSAAVRMVAPPPAGAAS